MQSASCPHAHPTADGLMALLRSGTEAKHAAAEAHPFQRALAQGRLPCSCYAAYLHQLAHVHRALELALTSATRSDVRIGALTSGLQSRLPDLDSDTAELGSPRAEPAAESTRQILDRIAAAAKASPLALVGMHYVLEGSKNGGRFIARSIRRAYSLSESRGTRYLDPHGDAQRDLWLAFKALMDAQPFSAEECGVIVGGAGEMFDAIASISQELLEAVPA